MKGKEAPGFHPCNVSPPIAKSSKAKKKNAGNSNSSCQLATGDLARGGGGGVGVGVVGGGGENRPALSKTSSHATTTRDFLLGKGHESFVKT